MRGTRGASLALRRLLNSSFSSKLANGRSSLPAISSCESAREYAVGITSSTTSLWSSTNACRSPMVQPIWSHQVLVRMSSVAAVEEKAEGEVGSPEVERLYKELTDAVQQKRMPESHMLPTLLQNCATPTDVKLALDVVDRLRRLKAVQGQQKANHSRHMAQLMVEACIRSGDPQSALKTLLKKNRYGFTPCIDQAHLLLKHALVEKDTKLMLQVFKAMVANEVFPTPGSADLIIRTCKDAGDAELLFRMAKEMHMNGVSFKQPLYDIIISAAANSGDVNQVHEVQKWREERGYSHTTASAFSLAKALVVDGKPEEAAIIIDDNCKDAEKRDMYLGIMVKVWPLLVGAKVDEEGKETFLQDLKEKLIAMSVKLSLLGCNIKVDVNEDFAKGKSSKSKAQEEADLAAPP